ncbi:MAG: hypothetical protein M3227_04075 [Thermoproteota archaeon]|nr:hypothetical protein [Thermoproteota archaeon]
MSLIVNCSVALIPPLTKKQEGVLSAFIIITYNKILLIVGKSNGFLLISMIFRNFYFWILKILYQRHSVQDKFNANPIESK